MADQETFSTGGDENLYHVKRTIIDYCDDRSGATRATDILGTYTSLPAAKTAARAALENEGYVVSDFDVYEENTDPKTWKYGDGVIVYARAPAGQEFEIRLDTKPNVNNLKGNPRGKVEEHLYHVLQTTIDYNNDHIGGVQTTEVEGSYLLRRDACDAANIVLLDDDITREWFEEYDEKDEQKADWVYGDDVLIHAVGPNGVNFVVEVKTELARHPQHATK